MTTQATEPKTDALGRHLFTVEEYERMSELGILGDEGRDELLEGVIYDMPTAKPPHASTVDWLNRRFTRALDDRYWIRVQNPARLRERSQPEPDITIAVASPDNYRQSHPRPRDILLVIEVSDTTYRKDSTIKLPIYAVVCIPEAWIVNLNQRRFEVYRSPVDGAYTEVAHYTAGQSVSPQAFPDLVIAVADVLPPAS